MKTILIPIVQTDVTLESVKNIIDKYRNTPLKVVLLFIDKSNTKKTELIVSVLKNTLDERGLSVLVPLKRELVQEYNYLPDFNVVIDVSFKNEVIAIVDAAKDHSADVIAVDEKNEEWYEKIFGLNNKKRIEKKLSTNTDIVLI